jgi:putative sugar O-methyltransferase
MFKILSNLIALLFIAFSLKIEALTQKSATGNSIPYREICKNAARDETVFENFRSMEAYFNAVECGQGGEFASYILNHATNKTLSLIPQFRKLDLCGNPVRNMIEGFGQFSGTTLRYILFADHISRLFNLPDNYTVAEIGAGFGGQAYILSQLAPFSQYYIYDLPEVEMLINKMMSTLSVKNVTCLDSQAELPEDSIDLFISNYALSECDRATQLDYFKRVVLKAKRGYILFNDTNIFDHLSLSEFIQLFEEGGIHPKILPEPVFSYTGNVLITWDKTNL